MKTKPVTDVSFDLQLFVRFLRKTGEGSLAAEFDLPDREELRQAVERLGPCTKSLVRIIEGSGIPKESKEVALHNLWSALASAYVIGSDGTRSRNTRAIGTAAGRGKRWSNKPKRDEIIDAALRARGKKPMKIVADDVNKELERRGLKPERPVSEGTLYKRWKTIRQTDEPKTDSSSD